MDRFVCISTEAELYERSHDICGYCERPHNLYLDPPYVCDQRPFDEEMLTWLVDGLDRHEKKYRKPIIKHLLAWEYGEQRAFANNMRLVRPKTIAEMTDGGLCHMRHLKGLDWSTVEMVRRSALAHNIWWRTARGHFWVETIPRKVQAGQVEARCICGSYADMPKSFVYPSDYARFAPPTGGTHDEEKRDP